MSLHCPYPKCPQNLPATLQTVDPAATLNLILSALRYPVTCPQPLPSHPERADDLAGVMPTAQHASPSVNSYACVFHPQIQSPPWEAFLDSSQLRPRASHLNQWTWKWEMQIPRLNITQDLSLVDWGQGTEIDSSRGLEYFVAPPTRAVLLKL